MKKIFMVLLLLPFTAIYFQIRGCGQIESKIKNFEFKLNENNQIDETNQQDFLDIWKDACQCVPTNIDGRKPDCHILKKVKVPWGWFFSSVLMQPCLHRRWPKNLYVDDGTRIPKILFKHTEKCVADECVLKAHYAYTLYKKIKKQIPWHRQPNLEENKILEELKKAMSEETHDICFKQWQKDYAEKVSNEKKRLNW